jgi:hypothetical protein
MQRSYVSSSLLRDVLLLAVAGALGWWARGGADARVFAQRSSSSSASRGATTGGDTLAFQFGGTEMHDSLTVYSPTDHTLYVYPAALSNSHINCAFSLYVEKPGGPIERTNCPIGSLFGH